MLRDLPPLGALHQMIPRMPFSSEVLGRDHTPVFLKVGSVVLSLSPGGCEVETTFMIILKHPLPSPLGGRLH